MPLPLVLPAVPPPVAPLSAPVVQVSVSSCAALDDRELARLLSLELAGKADIGVTSARVSVRCSEHEVEVRVTRPKEPVERVRRIAQPISSLAEPERVIALMASLSLSECLEGGMGACVTAIPLTLPPAPPVPTTASAVTQEPEVAARFGLRVPALLPFAGVSASAAVLGSLGWEVAAEGATGRVERSLGSVRTDLALVRASLLLRWSVARALSVQAQVGPSVVYTGFKGISAREDVRASSAYGWTWDGAAAVALRWKLTGWFVGSGVQAGFTGPMAHGEILGESPVTLQGPWASGFLQVGAEL